MNRVLMFLIALSVFVAGHSQITQNDGYYFKNGKLFTGTFEQHDDTGQLTARISVKNGLPDGISEYYSGGKLVEKHSYRNGDKHGTWEQFENEKKISEAIYHKDKKHDKWLIWDTNGTLRYEMYYKKGKKIGAWKMWDENGKLISEKTY